MLDHALTPGVRRPTPARSAAGKRGFSKLAFGGNAPMRLDDPVDAWPPELRDRQVLRTIDSPLDDAIPANRPITLRDLLTFRSGHDTASTVTSTDPPA